MSSRSRLVFRLRVIDGGQSVQLKFPMPNGRTELLEKELDNDGSAVFVLEESGGTDEDMSGCVTVLKMPSPSLLTSLRSRFPVHYRRASGSDANPASHREIDVAMTCQVAAATR